MSDFLRSLHIAASGMQAQSGRMRIVAENIANANSTAQTPNEEPYRRKIPTFRASFSRELEAQDVQLGAIKRDSTEFPTRYEPSHPAADANGYIKTPNVNSLIEAMDMRDAQSSYDANVNVVTATRRMLQRTIDLLKS